MAVTFPYNSNDYAFTLNNEPIIFVGDDENNYFDLILDVKVYDFYTNTEKHITNLDYKLPLFKSKQDFFAGEIIHRLMSNFFDVSEIQENQYLISNVSFLISQKDSSGNEINTHNLENVKFIAGLKPAMFNNNKSLLTLHKHYKKLTKTGIVYISLVNKNNDNSVPFIIQKNNEEVLSTQILSSLNIVTKRIEFADYNAELGDVFVIKYNNEELKYFIDKAGLNDINIIYEDIYKLKSNIQFTGEYSINVNYKSITRRYYKKTLENITKISSNNQSRLRVNTGWLFTDQSQEIDSLINAKRAWVKINNHELIEVTPVSKKLKLVDSKRQLHSFLVDFEIKKTNNAQSHSF